MERNKNQADRSSGEHHRGHSPQQGQREDDRRQDAQQEQGQNRDERDPLEMEMPPEAAGEKPREKGVSKPQSKH
jgi:hypothetical protein